MTEKKKSTYVNNFITATLSVSNKRKEQAEWLDKLSALPGFISAVTGKTKDNSTYLSDYRHYILCTFDAKLTSVSALNNTKIDGKYIHLNNVCKRMGVSK